jgi:hypothetical protein
MQVPWTSGAELRPTDHTVEEIARWITGAAPDPAS